MALTLNNYLVVHPATRWQRKQWPLENWVQTCRELLRRCPQIVVSVGPDSQEVALGDALVNALGPAAVSTRGRLDWAQLAGLLFGGELEHRSAVTAAVTAFAVFCGLSGVVYLCNDFADREADRAHPLKRYRPLAAGELSTGVALTTTSKPSGSFEPVRTTNAG